MTLKYPTWHYSLQNTLNQDILRLPHTTQDRGYLFFKQQLICSGIHGLIYQKAILSIKLVMAMIMMKN
jgi:hypothetical protein